MVKWMGYLQEFHIVIRYKKGSTNTVVDFFSQPLVHALIQVLDSSCFGFPEWKTLYATDSDYVDIVAWLVDPLMAKEDSLGNFYLKDGLSYRLGLLCMPSGSYRPELIREAHHSKVAGHFGMKKIISHLQRYFYWSKIQTDVERHVRACSLCSISKPSNQKLGKYQPLPVLERPWESISMDFLGGLPTIQRGHDYIFVVVNRFSKMAILIACTKTVTAPQVAKLFFQHVWTYFGLPSSIVSNRDGRFL